MTHTGRSITLIITGALLIAPALKARTCTGSGGLVGGYGWTGTRPSASASTTTAVIGSPTPIGTLLAGTVNSASFAAVGRVFLDGNGGIFATAAPIVTADTVSPLLQVGTYIANTDCTVSATITDSFATPGGAGLTPVQASATFEGVMVQNGNEIDLVQTGTGASGALLTLRKAKQFTGCTSDGFAGSFGLAAAGVATTPPIGTDAAVSTPFNLLARVVADGAGAFIQDSQTALSPLTARRATGTYTVNADCTGTGTLIDSANKIRKINFVVVTSGSGQSAVPGLIVAFTDTGVVGSGIAQQQ